LRRLQLAIAFVCLLPAAAFAQSGALVTNRNLLPAGQIGGQASSLGPTYSSHLVRSGNDCAPDNAAPVWGPGNALQGYSCYSNANGS
jgi:hypothetical protein